MFSILLAVTLVVMILIVYLTYSDAGDLQSLLIPGVPALLIIAITITSYFNLKIMVEGNFLMVKNVFILYRADIHQITKIRKGETMWSGFHKYGTATKGLIVFTKFKDDLYITPADEELFLSTILEINPDIVFEKV